MKFLTHSFDDIYQDYRLDKAIQSLFPWLGYGEIQQLLRKKLIKLNDKKTKGDVRLQIGDALTYPEFVKDKTTKVKQIITQDITPNILFEDDHLLILNKPAGLAVQGGSKTYQHLDELLKQHYQHEQTITPLLVHRLDQATSGVIVIAKNKVLAAKMGMLFKEKHDIQKTYLATCWGKIKKSLKEITYPIEKVVIQSVERMHASTTGLAAHTKIEILASNQRQSLLKLSPITGRKHQLRCHLAMIGHPILGDKKYNANICLKDEYDTDHKKNSSAFEPQFEDNHKQLYLHAYQIKFIHPMTKKMIDIKAPLPEHMVEFQSLQ